MLSYRSNELSVKEIKKTILIIIASKMIKYLVINLCKEMKDVCTENYKIKEYWNGKPYHINALEDLVLLRL